MRKKQFLVAILLGVVVCFVSGVGYRFVKLNEEMEDKMIELEELIHVVRKELTPKTRGLFTEPGTLTTFQKAEFTEEQVKIIGLITSVIERIEKDIDSLLSSDKNLEQNFNSMSEMTKWLVGIMAAMVVGVLAIAAGIFLNLRSAGKQKPT